MGEAQKLMIAVVGVFVAGFVLVGASKASEPGTKRVGFANTVAGCHAGNG